MKTLVWVFVLYCLVATVLRVTGVTHDRWGGGNGTQVTCTDGTTSYSGGRQGACSYHGGEQG